MHYNVSYKTKQFFFVLIKLSIVVIAFYFIFSRLVENENLPLSDFLSLLGENNTFSLKNIVFLLFLTISNWFFEILKWQNLVAIIKKITFKTALEQSLGGQTASLITPNRIGDYGAKAIYFATPFRKKIVLLNLIGNVAQMAVTTFFGIIGFILFLNRYKIEIYYYKLIIFCFFLFSVVLFLVITLKQKFFKIKGYSLQHVLDFINSISLKTHFKVFVFSLIRYLIFSFQFYFLLTIFNVQIHYLEAMIIITSMYLLASIIPTISIFDVVIKGSLAVFLFSFAGVDELTILSITTLMWTLNFVIPSLFGSYFVLNFKLPKTEE